MLSSLGFTPKGASRHTASTNSASRLFNTPPGFSVHVFKNPTLPSHSPPSVPAVAAPPKFDAMQARHATNGQWNRQTSYAHDFESRERKQLPPAAPASQDQRLVHVPTKNQHHAWPIETKHSKSHRSYGIYPSLTSDVYIYERSISSVSLDDELTSSPSSDSSDSSSELAGALATVDHLLYNTATFANLEISSTRASSSTETLESTLTGPGGNGAFPNVVSSHPPRPLAAIAAPPPRPASTRPQTDSQTATSAGPGANSSSRPGVAGNLIRGAENSHVQRNISVGHASVPPIPLSSVPLEVLSDDDSDTVISDSQTNDMVVDMLGSQWAGPPSYPYPVRSTTPFRERVPSNAYRRDVPSSASIPIPREGREQLPSTRQSSNPPQGYYRSGSPRTEEGGQPRAPPGLNVASPPDDIRRRREGEPATASSSSTQTSPGSRSAPSAPPAPASLARAPSTRQSSATAGSPPGPHSWTADMGSSSHTTPSPSAFPPSSSSPPRREARAPSPQHSPHHSHASPVGAAQPGPYSQGSSPTTAAAAGTLVVATIAKRSVRWTENLVCPSPVPPEMRRKGWFNRRGDQLWTNDGQFKIPEPGQEYPADLAHYPEPNAGWMNEDGTRIDMQHRLIPKPPLRSALKRPKPLNA